MNPPAGISPTCECFRVTLHGCSSPIWPGPSAPVVKPYFTGRIFERAWAVQEHLFAKRMIHFTNRQVLWEERGQILSEAHPDRRYQTGTWPDFEDYHRSLDSNEAVRRWYRIVQRYTACNLTMACRDKFMAIAALAKEVLRQQWQPEVKRLSREVARQKFGIVNERFFDRPPEALYEPLYSDYAAGLFKSSLADMLRWAVVHGKTHRRQSEWRAPTWSWASVDGPVSFPPESLICDSGGCKDCQFINLNHFDIQYQFPDNVFGPLISGSLYLRGHLLPCAKIAQDSVRPDGSSFSIIGYGPNQSPFQTRSLCWCEKLVCLADAAVRGEVPTEVYRRLPDCRQRTLLAGFDDKAEYEAAVKEANLFFLPLAKHAKVATEQLTDWWVDGLILQQVYPPRQVAGPDNDEGSNDQSLQPFSDIPIFRRLGMARPLNWDGLGSVLVDRVERSPERLIKIE
jgi:hypothetical protein